MARHKCGSVPRRLASVGCVKRRVRISSPSHLSGTQTKRIHPEHRQISSHTSTELSMVGDSVGHDLDQSISTPISSGQHPSNAQVVPESSSGFQKGLQEDPGSAAVLFHHGSLAQSHLKGCRKILEDISFTKEERPEKMNVKTINIHPIPMAKTKSPQYVRPSSSSSSVCHDSLGCFPGGMGEGAAHGQQDSLRHMVVLDGSLSYQLLGSYRPCT